MLNLFKNPYRALTILAVSTSSLCAMMYEEHNDPKASKKSISLAQPTIGASQEKQVHYNTAKERFEIVKTFYAANPQLTMTTPIVGLYEVLYEKDLAFIQQEIKKRSNKEVIEHKLIKFNDFVSSHFKKEMSFADYNFIAEKWAFLLSNKSDKIEDDLKDGYDLFFEEYKHNLKVFESHKVIAGGVYKWHFIGAQGIIMPHISPTGAVPILMLNEGFGFYDDKKKPRSIDFLAVGTDEYLNFDYLRSKSCESSWYHDYEHTIRAERFISNPLFFVRTDAIARLRTQIRKLDDPILRSQAELAFFDVFHEGQNAVLELARTLEKLSKAKAGKKGALPTMTGSNSLQQYQTNILGAKSLKLPISGENIAEQHDSYIEHLLKGLEILKNYAAEYDEAIEKYRVEFYQKLCVS